MNKITKGTKICYHCEEPKSLNLFQKDNQKKDGLRPMCQPCDSKYRKDLANGIRRTVPDAVRFWSRIKKTEDCWLWLGSKNRDGYGLFSLNGEKIRVHRITWTLKNGEIPEGLVSDHLCKNRACVNPDHIEMVTNGENVLRGESLSAKNKRKVKCQHGHDFDFIRTFDGARVCRTCERARAKIRYKNNNKEALKAADGEEVK